MEYLFARGEKIEVLVPAGDKKLARQLHCASLLQGERPRSDQTTLLQKLLHPPPSRARAIMLLEIADPSTVAGSTKEALRLSRIDQSQTVAKAVAPPVISRRYSRVVSEKPIQPTAPDTSPPSLLRIRKMLARGTGVVIRSL